MDRIIFLLKKARLVSSQPDCFRLWDVARGEVHPNGLYMVMVSSKSSTVGDRGPDIFQLFDATSGASIWKYFNDKHRSRPLVFYLDSSKVGFADNHEVQTDEFVYYVCILDTSSGQETAQFGPIPGELYEFAFSSNAALLACLLYDSVDIWAVASSTHLTKLDRRQCDAGSSIHSFSFLSHPAVPHRDGCLEHNKSS